MILTSRVAVGGGFAIGASNTSGGAVMFWHVDDLDAQLLQMGVTQYQPITEQGGGTGFKTAALVDPFGNVLGVMHNPHYLETITSRAAQV